MFTFFVGLIVGFLLFFGLFYRAIATNMPVETFLQPLFAPDCLGGNRALFEINDPAVGRVHRLAQLQVTGLKTIKCLTAHGHFVFQIRNCLRCTLRLILTSPGQSLLRTVHEVGNTALQCLQLPLLGALALYQAGQCQLGRLQPLLRLADFLINQFN